MADKPDAQQIVDHLNSLRQETWLPEAQKWWPKYLFHFTDIQNASQIIRAGKFTSRSSLKANGGLKVDIANAEVLSNTETSIFDHVRLYFRPLTNMQYTNEGVKLRNSPPHCPVPVVFLLDAPKVLSLMDSKFSNGNLGATGVDIGQDYNFFSQIPFNLVYHDTYLPPDPALGNTIKFHRHAEVIIPNELSTKFVKTVWCRSQAEHATLKRLVKPKTWENISRQVGVGQKFPLFFKRRFFIESVDLSNTAIKFNFNKHSRILGPFNVKIEITDLWQGNTQVFTWEKQNHTFGYDFLLDVSKVPFNSSYEVKFIADGNLIYCDSYFDLDNLF